ncbi:hypothetical protein ACHAXR_003898 [Thalassiosira sp. AJA248-18]
MKDHPFPNASDGSTKVTSRRSVRHSIQGWFILSIACTFANVFIGHRRVSFFRRQQRFHYEQNHRPPRIQRKEKASKFHSDESHLQEEQTRYDGEYITKILRGEKSFPRQYQSLKYRPGDLKMSSTEALQHCYVNTTLYKNHMKGGDRILVSASRRHKLIYRNIPKSSSSSARFAMENYFKGEDVRLRLDRLMYQVHQKNHTLISFIREPLNRFYSSYDEAFYRMGPWMGDGPVVQNRPMVRENYHKIKHKVMDKYSYLYENIQTMRDYRRLFCPEEILKRGGGNYAACNEAQTIDNGTLVQRFERFVQGYEGLDPFDIHLNLQVPSLLDGRDGRPLPISILYNASEAEKGWRDIADKKAVKIPKDGLEVGRKVTRRFNLAMVTNATKQKICRLMALDYCCLNIPLPEVCKMDEGQGVYCALGRLRLDEDISRREQDDMQRLIIEPS